LCEAGWHWRVERVLALKLDSISMDPDLDELVQS